MQLLEKIATYIKVLLQDKKIEDKEKEHQSFGDKVWIGVNATIVGKVNIGNNVLIAPNSYVNCDIPSDSVVFGNPCIIKHNPNATYGYIINTI